MHTFKGQGNAMLPRTKEKRSQKSSWTVVLIQIVRSSLLYRGTVLIFSLTNKITLYTNPVHSRVHKWHSMHTNEVEKKSLLLSIVARTNRFKNKSCVTLNQMLSSECRCCQREECMTCYTQKTTSPSGNKHKAGQRKRILISRIPYHTMAVTTDNWIYVIRQEAGGKIQERWHMINSWTD